MAIANMKDQLKKMSILTGYIKKEGVMWYETDKIELDYSIPIFAISRDRAKVMVLLPQINKDDYDVVGYNWFNIKDGEYTSCYFFTTIEEAIESYKNYEIVNGKLDCLTISH